LLKQANSEIDKMITTKGFIKKKKKKEDSEY